MANLTPERWQRVESLYRAALQRAPGERAEFLASACQGDQALRREVEWLLAQSAAPTAAAAGVERRRIGTYELKGLLGVGGMGEVYRAHDTRLGRDVAIKVLPHDVTRDADRIARFDREARVLAALNHPNIAIIHGVENAGDARAIVMELVEGETLAERLARLGPLPVAEALAIARQLADALDAAHEKGIVHRDLKPANIKLTPSGVVKVLDFGLATTARRDTLGTGVPSGLPTIAKTSTGVIVGTAAYMSPEQARGHSVDKRTDIWAFGCVLFELLTGRSPFARPTLGDTIAAVLEREPPWDLAADVPAHVRHVIGRCLEKDPRQRQRDIADARRDLDAPQPMTAEQRGAARRGWLPWAVAGIAVLLAAAGWSFAARARPVPPAGDDALLTRITWDRGLALEPTLSPDGSLVVYASDAAGEGNLDLWVQRVAGGTPVRLTVDVADDREPVFSPDGASVAFRSERSGGGIYVMPALGGEQRLIAAGGRRPQFSPDGMRIAFWTGTPLGGARNAGTAIFTVASNGGAPERLASEFAYARNPVWSPDGRSLVFFGRQSPPGTPPASPVAEAEDFDWWWTLPRDGTPVATGVYTVLREKRVTFAAASEIEPLPATWSSDGVLFSATVGQATNLWRMPLSPITGQITGPPVRLTTGSGADAGPTVDRQGRIAFQVSEAVESVFVLGLDADAAQSSQTIERLTTDWDLSAHRGSLSQNGRLLAYPRHRPKSSELWVKDLVSEEERHLTTTVQTPLNPTVSDDGAMVAYTVVDNGQRTGYVVPSAGGVVRKVCDDCVMHSWMPDGRRVLVTVFTPRVRARALDVETLSGRDLFETDGPIQRIFATRDGRWVAIAEADRAWIVASDAGSMATPATAQVVTFPRGTLAGRMCGWSPDGRLLYSLLVLDGFRCLYAQRVDPSGQKPPGVPFPVHHFHDPRRTWGSTPNSNAITARGFVFDHLDTVSSIWLLDAVSAR